MSEKKKIDLIREKNKESFKESPYNYCDRWCERCPGAIQRTCSLYLDEVGRQVFNIAHGRDEDDQEVLQEDLENMTESLQEDISEDEDFIFDEEDLINEDAETAEELKEIKEKVQNHSVIWAINQYSLKAGEFLKEIGFFGEDREFLSQTAYHLDTIAWYHSLLPAKINRAMVGFYEMDKEVFENYSCYDAIAQLDVCKKGVGLSLEALKALKLIFPQTVSMMPLLAMLHNIKDQIDLIERDMEERIDK